MQRIRLPERTYENFGEPVFRLYEAASLAQLSPAGFVVDVAGSKFLSPVLLCGVAALVRRHEEMGIASHVDPKCRDEKLRSYLEAMRFPQGISGDINSEENRKALNTCAGRPFVPMMTFPANLKPNMDREELLQGIENELARRSFMDGRATSAMKYILSEITGNINYHAGFGSGFVVAQYHVNNRYMDIAIADTGRGLLQTYLDSGKHTPSTDVDAMRLALAGHSAKAEKHRGFGIRTSRKMVVKGLGGWFLIWSGSAMFVDNASGEQLVELTDGTSLPGCFFALRIPTVAPTSFSLYSYLEN